MAKGHSLFLYFSYTIYDCITTVYRSYGAHTSPVVVLVAVRVEQVVVAGHRNAGFTVRHAWTEVSIA